MQAIPTQETVGPYLSLIREGGTLTILLVVLVVCIVVLWKFVGAPMLGLLSQLTLTIAHATADLRIATENTRVTSEKNLLAITAAESMVSRLHQQRPV